MNPKRQADDTRTPPTANQLTSLRSFSSERIEGWASALIFGSGGAFSCICQSLVGIGLPPTPYSWFFSSIPLCKRPRFGRPRVAAFEPTLARARLWYHLQHQLGRTTTLLTFLTHNFSPERHFLV